MPPEWGTPGSADPDRARAAPHLRYYLRRHEPTSTPFELLGHKDINVTAEIYVHNELRHPARSGYRAGEPRCCCQ
ncbi:MAG: hypothetical protein ACLR4Z_01475 [Butyricicoccaceae bacterium]